MSINQKIMTLFAKTPVHVGADNSVGAVDSPVMRERHTRFPIIPGSSLKGVISDLWNDLIESGKTDKDGKIIKIRRPNSDVQHLFGSDDFAGQLIIGEAKVLAFPVRSAKGSFAWLTCPLALQRYKRDAAVDFEVQSITESSECLASKEVVLDNNKVVLEEYCLTSKGLCKETAKILSTLSEDDIYKTIVDRLVIVSDEMFSYFVEHSCSVVTRIKIENDTGTVKGGALFSQEQVPAETMFYSVVGAFEKKQNSASEALIKLAAKIDNSTIQVGANETIGLGFCAVELH